MPQDDRARALPALRQDGPLTEELPDSAIDAFTRDTLARLPAAGLYATFPSLGRVDVHAHLNRIMRRRKILESDLADVCYLLVGSETSPDSSLQDYVDAESFLGTVEECPASAVRFGRFGLVYLPDQHNLSLSHYDQDFDRTRSRPFPVPVYNNLSIAQTFPGAEAHLPDLYAPFHAHPLDPTLVSSLRMCRTSVKPVHLAPLVAHYLRFVYERFRAGIILPSHLKGSA